MVVSNVSCDGSDSPAYDGGFFYGTGGSSLVEGNGGLGSGGSSAVTAGQNGSVGESGASGAAGASGSVAGSGIAGIDMIEDGGLVGDGGPDINGDSGAGGTDQTAGTGGSAGTPVQENPVCDIPDPNEFVANMSLGGGGMNYKESDHFVLFDASNPDTILNFMEAAHKCFVEDWCWRSSGLSRTLNDGIYYKTNIYSRTLMGAGGLMQYDYTLGLAYLQVLSSQIIYPRTTVHEYGHALTLAANGWVDQPNTGLWWESVANYVAYTFLLSTYCEDARNQYGIQPLSTIDDEMITLETVYGKSYRVILYSASQTDSNHYQAWPIWTYLTNNPDNYPGIGRMTLPKMWETYIAGSGETPIHQIERMAAPITAQTIIGRYWARMAYFDIGLPVGQQDFLRKRNSLNFAANLDSTGGDIYKVKAGRQPQYLGANITPLNVIGSGDISVQVTNLGNGLPDSDFTATLAIRSGDGSVRYMDCPNGSGQATVGSGEEVSLVVVNTPDTLYIYNPERIGSPENVGLNYEVQITGAVPSN